MDETLKKETKKGVMWSAVQRFSTQGIQFLTTLIMARMLTPTEYGTIGMLSIFLAISSVFIDSGFVNALTRKHDRTHADICTVFFFNITISVFFYWILFFTAPFIAAFYNMPELILVLRIVGLSLILNSFSAVQATLLTINLDFKVQARVTIIALIISSIVGIIMAYQGCSYWALVAQTLISCSISAILYWYYSKWRPTLLFSIQSFKELFGFGWKLLVSSLIDSTYGNLYSMVIGKVFSASALGNYSRAESYANFPSISLTGIMQRVTYPVLCRLQTDEQELTSTYRSFIKISAFVIFPLMMMLSALAYPFIILLIGKQWEISAAMLQILCFSLMWYPIQAINLSLLLVKGRSDLSLRLEIIKKIIGVVILCITIPMGIIALCYSRIVMSVLSLFVNTYYTGKLINHGFTSQMTDLLPTILISFGMWAIIMYTNTFTSNLLLQSVIGLPIGATFYIICSLLFNRKEFNTFLFLFKR